MNELRQHRLRGLKLRLKEAIILNRSVYLSSWELQHSWVTKEELEAIANELVVTGFCVLTKGRNGGEKLMSSGDESRREQAAANEASRVRQTR
jgi:hypothetical protein